jgi:hypothetical protein
LTLLHSPPTVDLSLDSFGHGIHAGIHWRSDTDQSILLGEAVALRLLQERAQTYNERFTVKLTKLDGTTATITNQ